MGCARLSTGDLYHLASELAAEHGAAAADYASRAIVSLEAEGDHERARFWFVMLVMLDDIRIGLVDPDAPIAIH